MGRDVKKGVLRSTGCQEGCCERMRRCQLIEKEWKERKESGGFNHKGMFGVSIEGMLLTCPYRYTR